MESANIEYVLHYSHDGHRWAVNFFACDDEDAERKTASLRLTLELKGRLMGVGGTKEEAAQEAAQTAANDIIRRIRG